MVMPPEEEEEEAEVAAAPGVADHRTAHIKTDMAGRAPSTRLTHASVLGQPHLQADAGCGGCNESLSEVCATIVVSRIYHGIYRLLCQIISISIALCLLSHVVIVIVIVIVTS
jgi:hypothetical protein